MKKLFLILIIATTLSLSSFASNNEDGKRRGRCEFLKELNLTDKQQNDIDKINEDYDKQIDAVKMTRIAQQVQREKIRTLRSERREAIKNILTQEQREQFSKGRNCHWGHEGIYSWRGCEFSNSINLTDKQKDQIKELNENFANERESARQKHFEAIDKILTPEQREQVKEKRSQRMENNSGRKQHGRMHKRHSENKI